MTSYFYEVPPLTATNRVCVCVYLPPVPPPALAGEAGWRGVLPAERGGLTGRVPKFHESN